MLPKQQVDAGSVELDDSYDGSLDISPLTQPSASTEFDFRYHAGTLTGTYVPQGVATLSVRLARGRHRPRTAPRLLAAERQVAYTLPHGQQLITRLAPR